MKTSIRLSELRMYKNPKPKRVGFRFQLYEKPDESFLVLETLKELEPGST